MTITKPSVAVFLNAFWIHGQGMSGGDQMAIQIFRRIRHSFADMYWFSNPDGCKIATDALNGVTFSCTPALFDRAGLLVSYLLRTVVATARLFILRTDLVYSGSDFFPDVLPAWLYTRFRPGTRWIQCVFHIYPDWRSRPGSRVVNWAAARLQAFSLRLARSADGVVNINTQVRDLLIERGFDPARLAIITPGVDVAWIESIPGATDDEPCFDALFLGRLNRSKGILDLPEIWKQVIERHPSVRLGIIGGGSERVRANLKGMIKAHGLEGHITLLGFVPSERIYALLKRARVFVFPSHEEGFGIAIVEALAAQVPVVAWNLPVFNELFGDSVVQVPMGDVGAFAVGVGRILDEGTTDQQRTVALETARRYSWSSIAVQMERWLLARYCLE